MNVLSSNAMWFMPNHHFTPLFWLMALQFSPLLSPEVEGPKTHYEPVRDLCPPGLRTCGRWAHDSNQTNELPLCYFSKSGGKANSASAGAVT